MPKRIRPPLSDESMFDLPPIPQRIVAKLQVGVDRGLADRVDATAKKYGVPRALLLRHVLDQAFPAEGTADA
ncbi:hypothetical protein MITS9508_02460 [Synechococcus sp. MIT S9508]|nr:hypothetical protein MITS9508_02460 [Synechococcus sp. MIT S9508]